MRRSIKIGIFIVIITMLTICLIALGVMFYLYDKSMQENEKLSFEVIKLEHDYQEQKNVFSSQFDKVVELYDFVYETEEMYNTADNLINMILTKSDIVDEVYSTDEREEIIKGLLEYQTKYKKEVLESVNEDLKLEKGIIDSLRIDVEDYLVIATKFRDRKSVSSIQEFIKEKGHNFVGIEGLRTRNNPKSNYLDFLSSLSE